MGCDDLTGRTYWDPCDRDWEPEVACAYPDGPYAARGVDDVPGPAFWPCSYRAAGEAYPLEHASLEAFHCDPEVESVVVFFASMADDDSPDLVGEAVALGDRWDELGSRWVWILVWDSSSIPPTPEMARTYFEDLGVTFGWFTNDEDDSWETYEFHNHLPGASVPGAWIIDARTMRISGVVEEPTLDFSRIITIAEMLATD